MTNNKANKRGNLREILIEAAMDMLAKDEKLTLRGAAQRAGVSHAAPAHHFAGLNGLRTAVAARAMQMFTDALDGAGRAPDQSSVQKMVDIGMAYCQFAWEHVDLFHLMFASADVDRTDEALLHASIMAYAQLRRACEDFVTPEVDQVELEHAIWSMTHGNALLQLQNPERDEAAPVLAPTLERQYRLLLRLPA